MTVDQYDPDVEVPTNFDDRQAMIDWLVRRVHHYEGRIRDWKEGRVDKRIAHQREFIERYILQLESCRDECIRIIEKNAEIEGYECLPWPAVPKWQHPDGRMIWLPRMEP